MKYQQYLDGEKFKFMQGMMACAQMYEMIHEEVNDTDDEVNEIVKKTKEFLKKDFEQAGKNIKGHHETLFQHAQRVGRKLGLKVEKSESLWTFMYRLGKKGTGLMVHILDYLNTDVTDNTTRKKIMGNMRKHIGKMEKREITNFILMLDANTTHMTVVIRHVIQALLGIEIGAYASWLSDAEWIEEEIEKIEKKLAQMPDTEEERKALVHFKKVLDKDILTKLKLIGKK